MSVGNLQAVAPVPAQPPVYGLLVAADVREETEVPAGREQVSAQRWEQGITWAPEQLGGGAIISSVDCGSSGELSPSNNPAPETAEPIIVLANDTCSTFGWQARDYEGRARRQLLATQSHLIANEFQLGGQRTTAGLANVALTDAQPLTAGANFVESFGMVEAAITSRLFGRRAMLHLTPQAMDAAMAARLVYQAGQKWLTALGNIVVSDSGYTIDTVDTMYGTALVQIRLSPIDVVPGSLEAARAQATDRATNLTTIWAERLALVQVDYGTLTTPADGPMAGNTVDAMFKIASGIPRWTTS